MAGHAIGVREIDVAQDYEELLALLADERPDAIVHFAEQRAAPYSMKSSRRRYTVDNNVNATHNLLAALVEAKLDAHVVHLGTMGVYGYGTAGVTIPGYLRVRMDADDGTEVEQEILFPANPRGVYHLTKTQDQLLFAFYNRNDELRITDLHQGIVWGTQTEETAATEAPHQPLRLRRRLRNGPQPLPHAGGHRLPADRPWDGRPDARLHPHPGHRAMYPAKAVRAPAGRGERVRIFNQMTETHRVIELAELVSELTGAPIDLVDNPRKEASDNKLVADNSQLLNLGLQPTRLATDLLREVTEIAERYLHRCDRDKIPCRSRWVRERERLARSSAGTATVTR